MLKNYFTIVLRNIRRQKFYSAINIVGLTLGLTASLLISLYIYQEIRFDAFHKDYRKIYHVGMDIKFAGLEFKTASTLPVLASAMISEIPGVEEVVRINPSVLKNTLARVEDKSFTENSAFFADSNFFQFFSFKLLSGDAKTVLKDPHTVVLTSSTAEKYFGDTNVMGKTILIGEDEQSYKITGVSEDAPSNSHIQFDLLLSATSDHSMQNQGWGNYDGTYTYFKLSPETDVASISQRLRKMTETYVAPEIEHVFGVSFSEFEKQGGIYDFFVYPLSKSHLHYPEITDGPTAGSTDIRYLYMMGAVGGFILIIACINFMNLSTARAMRRAREVGLRKAFGSNALSLIGQFLSESFLYVLAASIIASMASYFLLPFFNDLSGKDLSLQMIFHPEFLVIVLAIILTVSLLAGSYPAFYLTSFKSLDVLKGKFNRGTKGKRVRQVLVVLQFTVSILLIICTVVVAQQLHHMRSMDLGLDREHVLVIQHAKRLGKNQTSFIESIRTQSQVVSASYNNNAFPEVNRASTFKSEGDNRDFAFQIYATDEEHLNTLKIDLVNGRFFSKEIASDSMACVINEAAARELGWKDPLQGKLMFDVTSPPMPVIGVVKDFNFESFRSKVKPLVIFLRKQNDFLHVRYRGDASSAITTIESTWKKYVQHAPFEYAFLDQNFELLFNAEQRLGKLFTVMSSIAIFVACLGLLALSAYTTEQRTREIGIRKVIGASWYSINLMLSREILLLILISFTLASVAAWYSMDQWLQGFAFRTNISITAFIACGFGTAAIAWLTVAYFLSKAANANPCDALRCE